MNKLTKDLYESLKRVQWAANDCNSEGNYCIVCRALETPGTHSPDCHIKVALDQYELSIKAEKLLEDLRNNCDIPRGIKKCWRADCNNPALEGEDYLPLITVSTIKDKGMSHRCTFASRWILIIPTCKACKIKQSAMGQCSTSLQNHTLCGLKPNRETNALTNNCCISNR